MGHAVNFMLVEGGRSLVWSETWSHTALPLWAINGPTLITDHYLEHHAYNPVRHLKNMTWHALTGAVIDFDLGCLSLGHWALSDLICFQGLSEAQMEELAPAYKELWLCTDFAQACMLDVVREAWHGWTVRRCHLPNVWARTNPLHGTKLVYEAPWAMETAAQQALRPEMYDAICRIMISEGVSCIAPAC